MWNSAIRSRVSLLCSCFDRHSKGEGLTSFSNVSDIVILEVENALGVFDDGGSVRGDEELDRLGHTVVTQEGSRLTPDEFTLSGGGRNVEETRSSSVGVGSIGYGFVGSSSEFYVDEIDLELPLSLDTDENGGTTTSDNDLIGVVNRLENESESSLLQTTEMSVTEGKRHTECTYELHDDTLDERSERDLLALLRIVEVLGENSSNFGIGIGLELVSTLFEDETKFLVWNMNKIQLNPRRIR